MPDDSQYSWKYSYIMPASKISMPAGTDVCVVNTLFSRVASSASVERQILLRHQYSRIRSIARNAECPSFIWNTVGSSLNAFNARRPPMPSTISCRIRVWMSPP